MQDATPPTPPTPPADPAGQVPWEPFGPQQIMQVMNAAVHLCQASAAFMQRGLYVAVVAIPAGRPEHAEVIATGPAPDLVKGLEKVAAKVRQEFGVSDIVLPTPGQAASLNGLRLRTEE